MADDFATNQPGLQSPPAHVALVTPSDGSDLEKVTRGVSFVAAGDLAVVTAGGETVTIPSGALAAGIMHPLRLARIKATGTTATGIVAYW